MFHPVEITPPLDVVMEISTLGDRGRVELLTDDSVSVVANVARLRGVRCIWLEGVSGAGKSTFAARLAEALDWRHVDLDDFLLDDPPESSTYADLMDVRRLNGALGTTDLRSKVVVSGVCLRDVLALVGDLAKEFCVYIAKVSNPAPNALVWHNGIEMEQCGPDADWLMVAVSDYHGRVRP